MDRMTQDAPSRVTRPSASQGTSTHTEKGTLAARAPPLKTLASRRLPRQKIDKHSPSNTTPSKSNPVKPPRLSTRPPHTERLVTKISYKIDMKDPKPHVINEHCLVRVTPLSATHPLESSAVSSLVQSRYVMTDVI